MEPNMKRHRPTPSARLVACSIAVVAVCVAVLAGCTDNSQWDSTANSVSSSGDSSATTTSRDEATQPLIIASTSWIAAIAKAAGATNITIIAPTELQHPADYDPKPSDLASVAKADFILLGGFEAFADRLTQAAGSQAEVIKINADNTPEVLRTEVRKIADLLGTNDAAEEWITKFNDRTEALKAQLDAARPTPAPATVSHKFMAPWAEFAGVNLVGTFGPQPVTPSQLVEFKNLAPELIFDNGHVPVGNALDDLGAIKVTIINFPPPSLDLLEVFDINTEAMLEAFKQL
ncbi:MAG: ABC transporter substrate-binding protein [Microthrixaceae bacterium]|nr:ABC transporter substrate-binding protein [Microthrixaceae bacterium]